MRRQDYQQSGSKYGVGVSYSVGAQNGVTIDLAAGSNRGAGSGSDSTNVNTYVTATNTATIKSGSDTTLNGAVVQAETVKAEVGGNLLIQASEQPVRARPQVLPVQPDSMERQAPARVIVIRRVGSG